MSHKTRRDLAWYAPVGRPRIAYVTSSDAAAILRSGMTEVALIVLALANLYLVVRFIKWVRRDLPEELDQTTAMKLKAKG